MKNGGSAFPEIDSANGGSIGGMSLRDYFAAQIMPAVIAATKREDIIAIILDGGGVARIAKVAYSFADAMLEEREK